MFKSHLRSALRNLRKNKVSSFINVAGLAVGMAVALMIGLWVNEIGRASCRERVC